MFHVVGSFDDLKLELVALEEHRPTHYFVVGKLSLVKVRQWLVVCLKGKLFPV